MAVLGVGCRMDIFADYVCEGYPDACLLFFSLVLVYLNFIWVSQMSRINMITGILRPKILVFIQKMCTTILEQMNVTNSMETRI